MINIPKINIMNLLDKLKLDNNKKILLIISVCVVIIYIDFISLMKLQLKGIRAQTPKIITLKENIGSLAKDLSRMEELKKRINAKEQLGTQKIKKIISEGELPLLLEAISDMANQNKVRIAQINTPKDTNAKEELIAGEKLLPINITLVLSCTYHSLGAFINSLENAEQFIELKDMKIMRDSRDYFLESVTLTLKSYAKK